MRALSLALLLAAAPPTGGEEPRPAVAPVPVTSPSTSPAGRAPVTPPALIAPAPAAPAATEPTAAAPGVTPPLSRAAIDKIGQGDRSFLDRDYRNALFAYMDAAYLAPANPAPRIKLGRTYLALRYPARAVEQAEKALALDPTNAEAKRLLEDAKSGNHAAAPPRPAAPQAAAPASAPAPRVYRFVPDPQPPQPEAEAPARAPARTAGPAAAPRDEAPSAAPEAAAPQAPRAVAAVDPAPPAASPSQGASAAQRYRAALDLLQNREFEKAIAVLTDAVAIDPRLAVAYSARASAQFGLGRYREAATDYRTAIGLDARLGTPLYGLAECYRVLGESKNAAEMYRRYADSRASDVREDLRAIAAKRAQELR